MCARLDTSDGLRGAASSELDLAPPSLHSCVLAPLDPKPSQPHPHFVRRSKPVPVPKKPQAPPAPPSISSYSREEVINPRTGRKYIGARPLPGRVGARRLVRDDDGRRHWVHVNDLDNDWDVYFDGR